MKVKNNKASIKELSYIEISAFDLLEKLKTEREEFHKINRELQKYSDFIKVINITNQMQYAIIQLVNYIFDDLNLASYWLYEVKPKTEGWHIEISDANKSRRYNISTIEQLKDYYLKELK